MPPRRRVVITGLGVFASIGTGAAEFAAALRAGVSGRAPLTAFDTTGYAHSYGCPVASFEPSSWLSGVLPADLGRAAQFAAAAGRMAMADAGLTEPDLRAVRCHVCVGTTEGGSLELDEITRAVLRTGPEQMDPAMVRRVPAQSLSVALARELGLTDAEVVTIGTACAAGNYAIGDGFDAVAARSQFAKLKQRFGDEFLFHLEFMKNGHGVVFPGSIPVVRFSTEERLNEMIDYCREIGVSVANPHVNNVEGGGRYRSDNVQLLAKHKYDTKGLLNPGKMVTFERHPVGEPIS